MLHHGSSGAQRHRPAAAPTFQREEGADVLQRRMLGGNARDTVDDINPALS